MARAPLIGVVALALMIFFACGVAMASSSSKAVQGLRLSNGQGPIVGLRASAISVKDPTAHGVTCRRNASSPSLTGFKIGVWAIMDCTDGVLTQIEKRGHEPGDGMTFPGLARFSKDSLSALPSPGPSPTEAQCAAAWNSSTPSSARNGLAQLQPLAAEISVRVEQYPPQQNVIPKGPMCWVNIALPGHQSARIQAVWKNGTAINWQGIITPRFLSTTRAQFAVTSSGSLHSLGSR